MSVICPKCQHVRDVATAAPAWQCPACGIAYHKYAAFKARARAAVVPPRSVAPPPAWDGSLWALVATNLLSLLVAVVADWSLGSVMLLYWSQSVIIGLSNVVRILALDRFSTANFRINNRAVDPTPAVKRQTAFFFLVHYGMFHAVYLVFLIGLADALASVDFAFAVCMILFALNHAWSHRYNVSLDRRGTPNIGTLMFTPYLRIVPMHLTIVAGGAFGDSAVALVLFMLLKTGADAAMHVVEHRRLQTVTTVAEG
ncbi:MAG: DUF6498-containing protein [Gammaproteobacteria bacterium]